jgi:hypothetical protein
MRNQGGEVAMIVTSLLIAAVVTVSTPVPAGAQEIRSGNRIETTVTLVSPARATTATATIAAISIDTPGAARIDGAIICVHDTASGLYWWTFERANGVPDVAAVQNRLPSEWRFANDESRIVGFTGVGRSVWIRTSSDRLAAGRNPVDQAIESLRPLVSEIRAGGTSSFRELNLSQALGVAFFLPSDSGGPYVGIRIVDVTWSGGGWNVGVRNDRGQQRVVKLGPDFGILGVEERNQ